MAVDIVRLKNQGKEDFKDMCGSVPYRCPPKESIIVPWDAMCLWFGNPEVYNYPTSGKMDRDEEVHRIRTRFGLTVLDATGEAHLRPLPKVKFETLEGEEVTPAIFDPEAKHASVAPANSNLNDADAVAHELEVVKRQQALLLEQLNKLQEQGAGGGPSLDDIPDDIPTKLPVTQ